MNHEETGCKDVNWNRLRTGTSGRKVSMVINVLFPSEAGHFFAI
jgi:hypothetical protein